MRQPAREDQPATRRRTGVAVAAAAIAVLAAGCASQSAQVIEPEQPMVRQTSQTAPADLQLLCANEAAKAFGIPTGQLFPHATSRPVRKS